MSQLLAMCFGVGRAPSAAPAGAPLARSANAGSMRCAAKGTHFESSSSRLTDEEGAWDSTAGKTSLVVCPALISPAGAAKNPGPSPGVTASDDEATSALLALPAVRALEASASAAHVPASPLPLQPASPQAPERFLSHAMQRSPFIITVLALDGSMVYQNPLSISFFGDICSSLQGIPHEQRLERQRGLPRALLRNLFLLEGEEQLQVVLGLLDKEESSPGESSSAGSSSWTRVIRVPTGFNAASAQVSCQQLLDLVLPAKSQQLPLHAPGVPAGRLPQLSSPPVLGGASQGNRWKEPTEGEDEDHPLDVGLARSSAQAAKVPRDEASTFAATQSPFKVSMHGSVSADCLTGAEGEGTLVSSPSMLRSRRKLSRACSMVDLCRKLSHNDTLEQPRKAASVLDTSSSNVSVTDITAALSSALPEVPRRVKSLLDYAMASTARGSSEGSSTPAVARAPRLIRQLSLNRERARSEAQYQSMTGSAPGAAANQNAVRVDSAADSFIHLLAAGSESGEHERKVKAPKPPVNDCSATSVAHSPPRRALALAPVRESKEFTATSQLLPVQQWKATLSSTRQESSDGSSRTILGEPDSCWHQVSITRDVDAQSGKQVLLIYQCDVTARTTLESSLTKLAEKQLDTLCQIFPRHILEFMSTDQGSSMHATDVAELARSHEDISVLFMDIVGFTSMSKQVQAVAVMKFLNSLFKCFDDLCTLYSVHKVETAGDCYIVSSGLVSMDQDGFPQVQQAHDPVQSTQRLVAFAKHMLAASRKVLMPHDSSPVVVRVGIHTGSCVSGIVGSKLPKFGIFGDTMNTASRMESTCIPGRLQISSATYSLLTNNGTDSSSQEWCATGGIQVKGKGMMDTYLWREPKR